MTRTSTGQSAQRARQRLKRRRASQSRHHVGGYRPEMQRVEISRWMGHATKLRRLFGLKLKKEGS